MNLLALNPDLDPAKNPSLTPTLATAPKAPQKKNRERESQLI
jgi:hypothetical protein